MPRRYYSLREAAPQSAYENRLLENFMGVPAGPAAPGIEQDIYGQKEPEYQAILLRRLLRATEEPRERTPPGYVE